MTIVAELSANHGGDIDLAKRSILKAKEIGADAVKLQTFKPESITLNSHKDYFKVAGGTLWDGTYLYDLYQETYLPWEWHRELFDYAGEIGITIFSTPFDKEAVDFLEELGNPIYKIASFEITDIPLIEYAASKGKPIVISNGIAGLEDLSEAVDACRRAGNDDITLLQCTSSYPAKLKDANLKTMTDMRERFGVKVGLSDHTMDTAVSEVAVALGANMIEKHFMLNKEVKSADSDFSMTADEYGKLITKVRKIENVNKDEPMPIRQISEYLAANGIIDDDMFSEILGEVSYEITPAKAKNRKFARSLFVAKDVRRGDEVTESNVRSARPSDGMPPKFLPDVLGKIFAKDVEAGEPLREEMIE